MRNDFNERGQLRKIVSLTDVLRWCMFINFSINTDFHIHFAKKERKTVICLVVVEIKWKNNVGNSLMQSFVSLCVTAGVSHFLHLTC